jgi:hypothetical protein
LLCVQGASNVGEELVGQVIHILVSLQSSPDSTHSVLIANLRHLQTKVKLLLQQLLTERFHLLHSLGCTHATTRLGTLCQTSTQSLERLLCHRAKLSTLCCSLQLTALLLIWTTQRTLLFRSRTGITPCSTGLTSAKQARHTSQC